MGDNGNGRWIKFLRNEAEKYKPCLIILQLHHTAFSDNVKENLYLLNEYNELKEEPIPPPSKGRHLQKIVESIPGLDYSYLVGLFRQIQWIKESNKNVIESRLRKDIEREKYSEKLTFRILEEVLKICNENDWPIIGVFIDIKESRLDVSKAYFKENDSVFIEMAGKEIFPRYYFTIDGHLNSSGHLFLAKKIYKEIQYFFILKKYLYILAI